MGEYDSGLDLPVSPDNRRFYRMASSSADVRQKVLARLPIASGYNIVV
jgi:hypothetical protein